MNAGALLTAAVSLRSERPPPRRSRCHRARRCPRPSSCHPTVSPPPACPQAWHAGSPSLAAATLLGQCRGSAWPRWHTLALPPGLGGQAAAAGPAAGMHLLKHHEDVEMDLTGKLGSRLGPGRAPWSSRGASRAPTGLPSPPTRANKTRHKHRDYLPSQLSPPRPDKLFKSSIRKCKKCTRK